MADEETAVNGVEASADPAPSAAPTSKYSLVTDQYEDMITVEDESLKRVGAPNWRRLGGFPIYCTGQPNQDVLSKCVEDAVNKFDEQKNVLWVNLRQEPVLYVNGTPYGIR
ncbi:uncharacterized protein LOC111705627 [Eurytemora carolleeae]|uniref:uncharacterized protein LOC111705627 n=1 Tax=Eurytemora carolleeae TaxID=1294199 RepID=UPI000C7883D8|nr:uncharacterized protein LOC111705627 [Eurytemora carolleeae]|eukprot:XP_023334003.1 uncharacterized protein LOC111705627 [Eurytemora affinis]